MIQKEYNINSEHEKKWVQKYFGFMYHHQKLEKIEVEMPGHGEFIQIESTIERNLRSHTKNSEGGIMNGSEKSEQENEDLPSYGKTLETEEFLLNGGPPSLKVAANIAIRQWDKIWDEVKFFFEK